MLPNIARVAGGDHLGRRVDVLRDFQNFRLHRCHAAENFPVLVDPPVRRNPITVDSVYSAKRPRVISAT